MEWGMRWGVRARAPALVLAAMAFGAGAGSGQAKLGLGPRLGVAASVMRFEDPASESQTEALVGFQAGVALVGELGRFLSVEAGLHLARDGFGEGGAHTGSLHRDHVALPLLLRFRTPTRVSVHLTGGVAGKLTVRCRQVDVPGVGHVPCDDPVMGAAWKRLDVAGIMGAGLSVPWGHRSLATDLRVSWGLRDLDGGLFIPGSARSLSVGISVAILSPWLASDRGGGT
jgi:hypothetical protein